VFLMKDDRFDRLADELVLPSDRALPEKTEI